MIVIAMFVINFVHPGHFLEKEEPLYGGAGNAQYPAMKQTA
jgi:hypothetical protein